MKKIFNLRVLVEGILILGLCGCDPAGQPPNLPAAKAITAFGFPAVNATGTIDESAHTIDVTVPYGTNLANLVATFTSTGKSVMVGTAIQSSGVTPNDFSDPVTYSVVAEDDSTQDYIVTVTPKDPSIIPGGNIINQTWTAADSPYLIQGDITVPSGTILTIEPGTVVRFSGDDDMYSGIDLSRVEVHVRGTLSVNGSPASPVVFQADSGNSPSIWYGFVVADPSATVSINNALIKHANRGIYCQAAGLLTVASTEITQCISALYTAAGAPSIDAVIIWGNDYGLYYQGPIGGSVTNTIIRNNAGYGIYISNQAPAGSLSIINCTINSNYAYGIYTRAALSTTLTVIVRNTIITNNQGYGAYRETSGGTTTVTATYCDCWNNSSANWMNITPGTGCLSTNPLFLGAPTDLRLGPTSPCVDTGTDEGSPDYDWNMVERPQNGSGLGTYFDMGAYELVP